MPKEQGIEPSYEQESLRKEERKNKLQAIVSGEKGQGVMRFNQDARFLLCSLGKGKKVTHKTKTGKHGLFVFVIFGKVRFSGHELGERDSAEITDEKEVSLEALSDSEVLVIEVPM